MVTFISWQFYIFVTIVLAVYYILPLKCRWLSLLAASMGFYFVVCEFSKRRVCILLLLSLVCWMSGLLLDKLKLRKTVYYFVTFVCLVLPLFIIKEMDFAADGLFHFTKPVTWQWFIPVGIAFWDLQLIAYLSDVFQKKITPEKNYFRFLLFVSFFPQIIQGPIPRYGQLAAQLYQGHRFDERKFVKGFMHIVWGFFLKLCIADKAAVIVNTVFDHYPAYNGMYIYIAGVLYSLQLYADFLSCTTLAQGVSELFGITLADNFHHPYFAVSVQDFWRRWHISLSSWLRDYVYIPLGGNRKGKTRKYINVMVTFAVSGIWHGGGYKFLFWGLLHGFYQVMGNVLVPVKNVLYKKTRLDLYPSIKKFFQMFVTFHLVMAAWILFRAGSLMTGLSMLKSMITVYNPWILTNDALYGLGLNWKEFWLLVICLIMLFFVSRKQETGFEIREKILSYGIAIRWCIYIGGIIFVMIFGTYGYGFDSQAFIYGGF